MKSSNNDLEDMAGVYTRPNTPLKKPLKAHAQQPDETNKPSPFGCLFASLFKLSNSNTKVHMNDEDNDEARISLKNEIFLTPFLSIIISVHYFPLSLYIWIVCHLILRVSTVVAITFSLFPSFIGT